MLKRLIYSALLVAAAAVPALAQQAPSSETRQIVCTQFYRGNGEGYLNQLIATGKSQPGGMTEQYLTGTRRMLYDAFASSCIAQLPKMTTLVQGQTYATATNPEIYYLVTGLR